MAEKLSVLEILDLARFWSCDPMLRGYVPFVRGVLIKWSEVRPLLKEVSR